MRREELSILWAYGGLGMGKEERHVGIMDSTFYIVGDFLLRSGLPSL